MNIGVLFFCKTPLQSIIVNKILESNKENKKAYVLYIPNNKSQLHKIYFDKIEAKNKFFLKYNAFRISDTLSHLMSFYQLPKFFRNCTFNKIYFSSIGDLELSLLLGRNSGCKLHLFDDGTLNLEQAHFFNFITTASLWKRIISFFFRAEHPLDTYKKLSCYHTIFHHSFSHWIDCPINHINLFDKQYNMRLTKSSPTKHLRVFLGSHFIPIQSEIESLYLHVLQKCQSDVHIPHPGNRKEHHYISSNLNQLFINHSFEKMIAEEVVFTLLNAGYKVYLYGFSSTVLFNMSKFTPTISIALNANEYLKKDLFSAAGIKVIKGY